MSATRNINGVESGYWFVLRFRSGKLMEGSVIRKFRITANAAVKSADRGNHANG